jgi:GMP synthase-like glutamine amidotransferase
MILLVNICREKMHYLEFVKPIEDILRKNKIAFFTKSYREISKGILEEASRVIICGTSLKDNDFLEGNNLRFFKWINDFSKPILGICGGMQVIGLIFGARIKNKEEIGFFYERFNKDFLGLNGDLEVYHLHNNFSTLPNHFSSFSNSEIIQAFKHESKDIYGVLFHPEVRQKSLINKFCEV